MAKSSGAKGFDYRGGLHGMSASPVTIDLIIANSQTITLGDAMRINTGGFGVVVAAGEPILGICLGIVDNAGINIFESGRVAGTDGSTLTGDDTIAVSSTNQSDATRNIKARVTLSFPGAAKWYNDSNGTLAQTNIFQMFDTTSTGDQVDQATASDANGQFQLVEIDPDGDADASKGIFIVNETQLGGGALDSATTKIAA